MMAWELFWKFYLDTFPWMGVVQWLLLALLTAFAYGKIYAEEGRVDATTGQGMRSVLFLGGLLVPFWPLALLAVVGLTLFFATAGISGRLHKAAARKRSTKRAGLLESAGTWQRIADDPEQIEDTREAARAAARSLKAQADAVQLLKVNGKLAK